MKVNTEWLCQTEKRTGMTSSKGNQNKWCMDGIWYKADGLGYESLSEVVVSRLLRKTNINKFVSYEYEPLEQDGIFFHGCKSENFMTSEDVEGILIEFQGIYEEQVLNRVRDVMRLQMRKYSYLFV